MVLPVQLAVRGALCRRAGDLVVVAFDNCVSMLPSDVDIANLEDDRCCDLFWHLESDGYFFFPAGPFCTPTMTVRSSCCRSSGLVSRSWLLASIPRSLIRSLYWRNGRDLQWLFAPTRTASPFFGGRCELARSLGACHPFCAGCGRIGL